MEEKQETRGVATKTFVSVWLALLMLTVLTVAAAGLELGKWSMLANLLIASVKAGLVLWFFMQLRYERRFLRLLFLIPVGTIAVMIGLTFVDIWYR